MLLNSVWLCFTMHFGMRGVTPHLNMMWGDVELKEGQGGEYLEFTERTTKTRTGKTSQHRHFPPKAFAVEGINILFMWEKKWIS